MLAISTVAFYCTITITVMYSFWILRNGRMIFLWGYFESSQQNLQQNNSRTVDSTGQFVPIHCQFSPMPYLPVLMKHVVSESLAREVHFHLRKIHYLSFGVHRGLEFMQLYFYAVIKVSILEWS